MTDALAAEGRLWRRGAIPPGALADLVALADAGNRPGARLPLTPDIATRLAPLTAGADGLHHGAFPTRLVSFAKSEGVNWAVGWHQDKVISVRERMDAPGFGKWTCKDACWHCEPPPEVLRGMLFVRLHLDANTAANGAMEIVPRSHLGGLLSRDAASALADRGPTELCTAAPGDVLILDMLMLHRSSPSRSTAPRRVLRVDYATAPLPAPLRWPLD